MHIKLMPRVKESERTSVFFGPEDLFREIEIEGVCVWQIWNWALKQLECVQKKSHVMIYRVRERVYGLFEHVPRLPL